MDSLNLPNSIDFISKKAIYAGSFDPLTNGHLWMIKEGAKLFDYLIVAIGENPAKKPTFNLQLRIEMIQEAVKDLKNVKITSFCGQYLVNYAREIGANFILRGIRQESDYEYERGIRHINNDLDHSIGTVFLMPPKELSEVSSSMVKGLIGPSGWARTIDKYIPKNVFDVFLISHLQEHYKNAKRNQSNPTYDLIACMLRYDNSNAYHNLTHIVECLDEYDKFFKDVGAYTNYKYFDKNADILTSYKKTCLYLAILFHDFIYVPGSSDNEVKSAQELFEWVDAEYTYAGQLIRCTKEHNPKDLCECIICDIDLSIFAKSEDVFDSYDESIRKEYFFVPEKDFINGRSKILKSFIERPFIYNTNFFRDLYEEKARYNIKRILNKKYGGI